MRHLTLVTVALALVVAACSDDTAATTQTTDPTTTAAPTTTAPTTTEATTTTAPTTTAAPTTAATTTTELLPPEGVEVIEVDTAAHTGEAVDYETDPPVGGLHNPEWLTCGVYDEPVPNEMAVHSLEHGAVWITYHPDLPADQLRALLENFGGVPFVLISPYPDLPSPISVVSWEHLLRLDAFDFDAIARFILVFRFVTAPESGAPC